MGFAYTFWLMMDSELEMVEQRLSDKICKITNRFLKGLVCLTVISPLLYTLLLEPQMRLVWRTQLTAEMRNVLSGASN